MFNFPYHVSSYVFYKLPDMHDVHKSLASCMLHEQGFCIIILKYAFKVSFVLWVIVNILLPFFLLLDKVTK